MKKHMSQYVYDSAVPRFLTEHRVHDKYNTIWPDSISLHRIESSHYVEKLTGIELKADTYKTNDVVQVVRWRIIFPETKIELPITSLREGRKILWEFREALKRVIARYFVTTRHYSGREWTVARTPDYARYVPPNRRKHLRESYYSTSVWLACV